MADSGRRRRANRSGPRRKNRSPPPRIVRWRSDAQENLGQVVRYTIATGERGSDLESHLTACQVHISADGDLRNGGEGARETPNPGGAAPRQARESRVRNARRGLQRAQNLNHAPRPFTPGTPTYLVSDVCWSRVCWLATPASMGARRRARARDAERMAGGLTRTPQSGILSIRPPQSAPVAVGMAGHRDTGPWHQSGFSATPRARFGSLATPSRSARRSSSIAAGWPETRRSGWRGGR